MKHKRIINLFTGVLMAIFFVACNNSNSNDTNYSSYQDAISANDYEAAHKFLTNLYNDFIETKNDNFVDMGSEEREKIQLAASNYSSAARDILCAEARFLISEKSDIANDRIEYLFNEIKMIGEKVPAGSELHPGGYQPYQEICLNYYCYNQTVSYNNALCDIILNLALRDKNEDLAKIALSHYLNRGITKEEGYDDVVYYDSSERKKAKEKYEKNFGNYDGVFADEDSDEDLIEEIDQDSEDGKIKESKHSKRKRN